MLAMPFRNRVTRARFLVSESPSSPEREYAASPQLQESDVTIVREVGLPNWTASVPKANQTHLQNALA